VAGGLVRGEIRLYQFAPPDKKRPVVVLTRSSSLRFLSSVTIAPITSSLHGAVSEVILTEDDGMKSICAVNLHNITTVPQHHVGKRVGQLSEERMRQLCAAIRFSMGCD
jgi:mRNA interferase MazF